MRTRQTTVSNHAHLTAALTAIRDRAAQLETDARAERLEAERALSLAKGTRDLTEQSKAARSERSSRDMLPPLVTHGPYWIGDGTSFATATEAVTRYITEQPRTRQDIIDATGIRGNRVNGILHRMQVRGLPLKNLGDGRRAIWYLPAQRRSQRVTR